MRRHPQNPPTNKDVGEANRTLNILGGKQQRPWMINPFGASVPPKPRTATKTTHPPPIQHPLILPRASTLDIAPAPAPAPRVLESPTPEPEEANGTIDGQNSTRDSRNDASNHVMNSGYSTAGGGFISHPAMVSSQWGESGSHTQGLPQQHTGGMPFSPTQSPNQHLLNEVSHNNEHADPAAQRQSSLHGLGFVGSSERMQGGAGAARQDSRDSQPPEPQNTSSPSERLALPSTMLQDKNSLVASNPYKRVRTQMATMPSLKNRLPVIDQFINTQGGYGRLNQTVDGPRFALLKTACADEDLFYVILHQLYCLWDANQVEILPAEYGLPSAHVLHTGFLVLGQFIKLNSQLSPINLHWFSVFPSPFTDLMRTSAPYRDRLVDVGNCIQRLGAEWPGFSHSCLMRGYPPLVDEMIHKLGLLSIHLQEVVFTASRRNLGFADDRFGADMTMVFRDDQAGHNMLSARYNTASPPTQNEITSRQKQIISRYIILKNTRLAYLAQMQSYSQTLQNPAAPNHAFGHPQNNGPNMPVRSNLWQDQQTPMNMNPAGTTGPPNPSLASVVSSTSAGQNFGGSPSPTFMQNLSMQSGQSQQVVQQNFQGPNPRPIPSQHFGAQAQHPLPPEQHPQSNPMRQNPQQSRHPGMASYPDPQHPLSHQQMQAHALQARRTMQEQALNQPRSASNSSNRAQRPTPTRQNTTQSSRHHQPVINHVEAYKKANPLERPLIPPVGYVPPAQASAPEYTALHQAHLRSPKLISADLQPSEKDSSRRFYQTVKSFALSPVKMPQANSPLLEFPFEVTPRDYGMIAKDKWLTTEKRAVRTFRMGTIQYRLKCIKTGPNVTGCTMPMWTISDTSWPEAVYLQMNDEHLEVRRKLHFGKDLPVDVTSLILASNNKLKICIPRAKIDPTKITYYLFAVEVIEVLKHDQIMNMCLQGQRIPAETTLNGIMKSLAPPENNDDDFAMVVSDLSIDLADPFTARIFDIPARGSECLHRECFDLETFLETRTSKLKRPDQPSVVDTWKCPLCSQDARPDSLRVDGFLEGVRERLEREGGLDTKAILVSVDGTWRAKPEEVPQNKRKATSGLFDEPDSDEEGQPVVQLPTASMYRVRASAVRARKPAPQVIDLDSD